MQITDVSQEEQQNRRVLGDRCEYGSVCRYKPLSSVKQSLVIQDFISGQR